MAMRKIRLLLPFETERPDCVYFLSIKKLACSK